MANFVNFYEDFQKYTEFSFNNSREFNFLKANIKLSKLINKLKTFIFLIMKKSLKIMELKIFIIPKKKNKFKHNHKTRIKIFSN